MYVPMKIDHVSGSEQEDMDEVRRGKARAKRKAETEARDVPRRSFGVRTAIGINGVGAIAKKKNVLQKIQS